VELNCLRQKQLINQLPEVADAAESRGLKVHALLYDKTNDELFNLAD
jgi:hypothetical protein